MTRVASTKMVACNEIAMTGTRLKSRSLVRHRMMSDTRMHTAMTYSVFPMWDQNIVMVFHVLVRSEARVLLTDSSLFDRPLRGPVMRKPKPTIAAQTTTPGATALVASWVRSCREIRAMRRR